MKVLLTTHQFFPEFCAGTEVLTLSVARELIARGHDVRILTGYPSDLALSDASRADEYVFDGIHIHRFHHGYMPMGGQRSKIEIGFDNQLAADYFSRVLASFCPDVVHFFHFNRLGTGMIGRATGSGIPAFFTPTDFWAVCPTGQLLYGDGTPCPGPSAGAGNCILHFAGHVLGQRVGASVWRLPGWAGRALSRAGRTWPLSRLGYAREVRAIADRLRLNIQRLNQLDAVVAPNKEVERLMVRYGVRSDRLAVVPYGVDVVDRGHCRDTWSPQLPLRIGFIGTLGYHKGCHVLLEAFRAIPPGQATLRIYGGEADFPEYVAKLRKMADGVSGVEFCGTFPNSAIGSIFDNLDVLVVPSVWNENTPLVVYSAQASRCPIIGSDVPGIAAAVRNGVDGILFEPGNALALTGVIGRLAQEPSVLARLSAAGTAPRSVATYVDDLMGLWARRHR